MTFEIKKYDLSMKDEWDNFLDAAANTHFFFKRDFLDYHKDRFNDHSLMFYNEKSQVVALLPANENENVIYSHAGISFGGLVKSKKFRQEETIELFKEMLSYLKLKGIKKLVYKAIPRIYCNSPGEEDLYALFSLGSTIFKREVSSTIFLEEQLPYSKGRKWLINKAKKSDVSVKEIEDLKEFWENLNKVLKVHSAKPVHSLDEILLLKSRFPDNIKVYASYKDSSQLSGAVLFKNNSTMHAQYLFNTDKGRELGALDFLIDYLITEQTEGIKIFDFGISTTDEGLSLNEGLISQKENFGARATCNEFHELYF